MSSSARVRAGWLAGLALLGAASGCNALLGMEEGELKSVSTDASAGSAGAAGSAGDGSVAGAGGSAGSTTDAGPDVPGPGDADASVEGGADADADAPPGDSKPDACTSGPIATSGDPCCKPSELACAGHAQKLQLFCDPKSHLWAVLGACTGKQLCDTDASNQGGCDDPVAVCIGKKPGDKVCDGQKAVVCGPDLLTVTNVQNCPSACKDGVCSGTCTQGAKQCNGYVPQTCDAAGAWIDAPACPYVCDKGYCIGVCKPGEKQCSGNNWVTCDAAGAWVSPVSCDPPQICVNGACASGCTPGTTQCSSGMLLTCQGNGQWDAGKPCQYVCAAGACGGVCLPGAKQCATGGVPQICDATGNWESGTACPYLCTDGTCTGECTSGARDCVGLVPRRCGSDAKWVVLPECTYVCSAGSCTGVCAPGSAKCNGLTPEKCGNDGQWDSGTPCPNVCTAGTCTGACSPGTQQCNGNTPQTCDTGGQWVDSTPCPYVCATGACTGSCVPNTKQCGTGGVPQTCDANGDWQSGAQCPFACSGGDCVGVCVPTTKRCNVNAVEVCGTAGQWGTGSPCSGTGKPVCTGGQCAAAGDEGASCIGLAANCGDSGSTSCCRATTVPGGTFNRSNKSIFPATVSAFRLDSFEVTVGRFRKFVEAYPASKPTKSSGKNPNTSADPGWSDTWDSSMPVDQAALIAALKCDAQFATWTDAPGTRENLPINCVNWQEAFAFCIWDGGRLPTEAEWNYAAAAGADQRDYPWGSTAPGPNADLAVHGCYLNGNGSCVGVKNIGVVGSAPNGNGKWGQADLGGNMWEWGVDVLLPTYPTPCTNCAVFSGDTVRMLRGGGYNDQSYLLVTSYRYGQSEWARWSAYGMRCARTAP
jgi:formylglycine-generating enzyme required for sulfatase activity